MYHNVMNLLTHWYFVQAGPLDPRAKTLPLPDPLMGELVRYVVAHEVGHTLGLPHNMKASSLYPFEKLRDPKWLKENGHTPTIMDYSRFNYVVQPEDGVPAADLIPKIGPYDLFAIKWGYQPIAGATSPDAEKKTLDEWARQQDQTPWLRFSTSNSAGSDPGELTEAVGDADAIQATTLGLKNLERVGGMLLTATVKPGEPYDDLQLAYTRLLGQWVLEMNHVSAIVGGFDSQQKHGGQAGVLFTPIPKARQVAAVQFLNAHAFQTPAFLVRPDVLRRIEPAGALDRLRTAQQRVLSSLLSQRPRAAAGRARGDRRRRRVRPDRFPGRRPPRRVDRAGRRGAREDRRLPAQPAAGLARDAGRAGERPAGGVRRRPRLVPPGTAPARRAAAGRVGPRRRRRHAGPRRRRPGPDPAGAGPDGPGGGDGQRTAPGV